MSKDKFALPPRYKENDVNVWIEYSKLAVEYKPLNLGLGFPDSGLTSVMSDALHQAACSENALLHQYTRGFGHPRLVVALSKLYSSLIGRVIDPMKEFLITVGAGEALTCAIFGFIVENDEVIVIEPYFDAYIDKVQNAGGTLRYIPLKLQETVGTPTSSDWTFDPKELESVFNEKTKLFILNTPHNPLGKVFSRKELQMIADLCVKWNVVCISDEVYEWLVCEPNTHIRICTLPGMWERTLTIGSAGKTFSITGWKTGWVYGHFYLIRNLATVHQNLVGSAITPVQEALSVLVETELARLGNRDCYFTTLKQQMKTKRDFLVQVLLDVGMRPTIPDGGYFVVADYSAWEKYADLNSETDKYKDWRFTKWMTKNVGLQGIPPSAFCSEDHKYLCEQFVRYCFFKDDATLQKAADILKNWKNTRLSFETIKLPFCTKMV